MTIPLIQRIFLGLYRRVRTRGINRSLRRHGRDPHVQIPTFTIREELEALFNLARACQSDARILEVGSYLGASAWYLAAGMRGNRASIVCIDTWRNETMPDGVRDTLAEFESNVKPIRSRLSLIRKPSREVTPDELKGPFDLVFLDGDHSYNGTREDFQLTSGLLAPGGILAFHDVLYSQGVSKIIGQALASGEWQIGGMVNNLLWLKPAQFAHPA